ncbi:MAG TPA: methylmalonyl Co-A mutase-associated GTPase MeaB [Thermoflexales bacterium]|nr:methylmalonyl Co-A mutase-associated GTPase MeaB [Thermoflexales bacterium]HQZ22162.1 methylmalonyl Co-A mutase-associated GTPase MeaB [Thermoflexales bacterium]HRA00337.1 methylmalonyl Co-A mutase-associated GTPase MeaB [Thermoflexales bacterium]
MLAGRQRAIARAITLAESNTAQSRELIRAVYPHTGRAHVVGITGVPGSGKSTLTRVLAQEAQRAGSGDGLKIGILAVDPSSPFTGGALLGDRIRMNELSSNPRIFIRSMATRGSLGGLAHAALDAVDVLDAAGCDLIIIETVGVGQDEVDIARAAHTVVVVSAPGLGDDIQAIKSGILEIADIHAVSKCDKPESARTIADLKNMLMGDPSFSHEEGAWHAPVVGTSAETGAGVSELLQKIFAHRAHLAHHADGAARARARAETRVLKIAEDAVRATFARQSKGDFSGLIDALVKRDMNPHDAADVLLAGMSHRE